MEITDRVIKESPLFQGINEKIVYTLDASVWGISSPTGATITVYNDANEDVSATHAPGTAVIDGSTIYAPELQSFVANERYKVFFKFAASDGQIKEPWTWLYGQDLTAGAARAGMEKLVTRIRQLTNADVHEFAIAGQVYWADKDIQEVLDRHALRIIEYPLEFEPRYIDGTVRYTILPVPFRDLETPESGSARWELRNSTGVLESTANYTFDWNSSIIEFNSDTGGTVTYNLTARMYDIYATAADIWEWRIANFALFYDFKSENQSMSRSQMFKNAKTMRDSMIERKGSNIYGDGDIRVSQIVRADIVASTYDRSIPIRRRR